MRKVDLPQERRGRALSPELLKIRKGIAAAKESGVWRTEMAPQTDMLGGVRVLRFQPSGDKRGTVLHFHGGAFRIGCPEQTGPFAAALAARCDVEVVCPAYRLAPEHPFPAGLNDAYAVLSVLNAEEQRPLIISGDSAGGGLAVSLTRLCADDATPPKGLVLLSAWLDLTVSNPSHETNAATDPLFSAAAAREAAELYLQGLSPRHPLASPVFASVEGFPPTFISAGEGEVLADDARQFHAALLAAGVSAMLLSIAGMEHTAVVRNLKAVGAPETLTAIAEFIGALTNSSN